MLDTGPRAGVIALPVPVNVHCSLSMKGPCSNDLSPLSPLTNKSTRKSHCQQEVTGLAQDASLPRDNLGTDIPLFPV
jgi:hypothetical protein